MKIRYNFIKPKNQQLVILIGFINIRNNFPISIISFNQNVPREYWFHSDILFKSTEKGN